MSEQLQRNESLQPLHEAASVLVQEMGEQPQERLDWLMQQTGESFGAVLLHVNSTSRGLSLEKHSFDGEGIQAGSLDGSIPPDQKDKITLLSELVTASQRHIATQTEQGEDAQTIMSQLAVAIPTVVNKLHLFADGNGRTSRMLRMVMRDGDQITPEKVETLVLKSGHEKYDTTPATAVELSVMDYMRNVNGTSEIIVSRDVVGKDTFPDEEGKEIMDKFPDIHPSVIRAYSDYSNFSETVRLMAKEDGVDSVSLTELFSQIEGNPERLAQFTSIYSGVRKQRVELLISGLTSELSIPLSVRDKEKSIHGWINYYRTRRGLDPIDPALIETIEDFQIAYCETFSPDRDSDLSQVA